MGVLLTSLNEVWINTSDVILVGLRDYQGVSLCTQMRSPCLSLLSSLGCWCAAPFSRDWQFSSKVNETDTFGPREDDEIQFDDVGDDDEDIDDI
ncbi:eukaryotic translation initiation factor 1A, Y-chromosomal-like isoform X1 [Castor canadensis]|uniref:Eukaryotic translation initiation factor 1A, Y-chromosomal-like isoform X2 n=6 Tax=Castor canadensis TaxID=51338 RepID=A0AC58LSK8_CASCN